MRPPGRTAILVLLLVAIATNLILLFVILRLGSLEAQISALEDQVRRLLEKLYVKGPF